jgi:two-component system response regulator VanR
MRENPITILVAEDEDNARRLYQIFLLDAGYQVLLAKNGLEALAELRDEKVDLLLTDLKMPDMSALEMIPLVRKDRPELPIVVVSAYYRDMQEEFNAKGYNVQGFFNKPVNMATLLGKIKELVGAPPLAPKN